jgi:hypothetical protein
MQEKSLGIDAPIDVKGCYHRWEMQISPAEEEFYGGVDRFPERDSV